MGLFDTDEGGQLSGISNVAYAANMAATTANQPSMEESLGDVVTKFAPLTLMSVYNSFHNDAVAVNNFFGGDAKPVRMKQELEDMGYDDLGQYYARHQQGIEAAGLLTGTAISGLAGVGLLNVVKAGRLGLTAARAMNLGLTPTEDAIAASKSIIENSSSLFPGLTADKVRAIGLGVRDNLIMSVAFETAAAATMQTSPLLENNSWQDTVVDMGKGLIFGTVVGGGLEGLSIYSKLNKAMAAKDLSSKESQLVTYAFKNNATALPGGEPLAGDKVALAVNDMWDIPVTPGDALSQARATSAQRFGLNRARESLRQLAGTGNEDFSDALFNMVWQGRLNNAITKEQAADQFAGLRSIRPVGDDRLVVPATDEFYANKYISTQRTDASGKKIPFRLDELLTPAPTAEADVTRRFIQRDPNTSVKIAAYDMPFTQFDGRVTRLYDNAQDAFNDGYDVFWNQKGEVIVSAANNLQEVPLRGHSRILSQAEQKEWKATGMLPKDAAPLYSEPSILNIKTKEFLDGDIVKSLGDYAGPDKVKVVNNGVHYGNREFSPQTLDGVLDSTTSANDAQARFLWFKDRGVTQKGLQIFDGAGFATADLPALEAMYYEGVQSSNWADYVANLQKRGVTFASGDALPATEQQMLTKIQGAKDDFIRDVYAQNKNLSAEEIARRANVSTSYLESGLQGSKTEDFMRPLSDISDINHVQLQYNIGNTARQDGNYVKGLAAAQYRIQMLQDTVNAAGSKFFGERLPGFKIQYNSSDATYDGTKPGFFTFSNGAYGTLANAAERAGRNTEAWTTQMSTQAERLMSQHFTNLRSDPEMFGELSNFIQVRHSTPEHYRYLPDELQQQYLPNVTPGNKVSVLEKSLVFNKAGDVIDWNRNLVPDGFYHGATKADLATTALNPHAVGLKTFYELSSRVADFEDAMLSHNDMIVKSNNTLRTAQGLENLLPTGRLHAPAIDMGKYPYFAIVKPKAGSAFADGSTSVITAADEAGLKRKIGMLDANNFDVYLKNEIKDYKQIQGEYEYSRNFNTGLAREEMRRKGVLNDALPSANPEVLIKDYVDFMRRQVFRTTRDYVETLNDQLFTELRAMGEVYTGTATSQAKWWSSMFEKAADNPYESYIQTALGLRGENYQLWRHGQEVAESYASSAYNTARSAFIQAKKGDMTFDQASALSEAAGLGNPYARAVDKLATFHEMAAQLPPRYLLSKLANAANSILSATAIRLDTFQSLINAMSAPILTTSELLSARKSLMLALPTTGGQIQLPSVTKVLAGAIGDVFNSSTRSTWMPILKQSNVIRDYIGDYFKLTDELSLPIGTAATESGITSKIKNAVDIASKFTGAQFTEDFGRYWSAMAAKRLFEEAGYTGQGLIDNMITFVNRSHGNYTASQRPTLFQGPVAAVATLFQTYQMNLFQQLFRYVGNRDYKALAVFHALQGTAFGVQGLPGIQYINQALIGNAASNPAHKDMYSTTINAFDKELGDWMLYGAVSNISGMGLYSRGDINPRNLSVISLNPLEWPAIAGGINFLSSLYTTTQKLTNGGAIWATLMQGLEHNGLSRPLSGLAQLAQGYATTGQGSLVSAAPSKLLDDGTMGWSDMQIAANYGRILGARPLDEAIIMDTLYRSNAYEAKDRTRMEQLGAAFKTNVIGGTSRLNGADVLDFAAKYAASGGQMQNFNSFIINTTKAANVARGNEVFMHLAKPLAQQMMMSMGGKMLPDYSINPPSTAVSEQQPLQ